MRRASTSRSASTSSFAPSLIHQRRRPPDSASPCCSFSITDLAIKASFLLVGTFLLLQRLRCTVLRRIKMLPADRIEPWARLADEVLANPVYHDNLKWEAAERVLTGDDDRMSSKSGFAVAEILEISDRFRWDNEDKAGWERVNFGLLGTSQGEGLASRCL